MEKQITQKIVILLMLVFSASLFADDFDVEVKEKKDKDKKEDKQAEIVVTGSRIKKQLRKTPIKTDVIGKKDIENKGAMTLFEALEGESGVNANNTCLNCGAPEVGLNGLSGGYTQILFDGMPLLPSTASVYFLQQYPSELISRIEIVKGGGSASYGSGAIGGIVNIITRKPVVNTANISFKEEWVGLSNTWAYTLSGYASAVSSDGKAGIAVYGMKLGKDPYDRNGDGVSERGKMDDTSYGFNGYINLAKGLDLTIAYTGVNEFRRGGDDFNESPIYSGITEQADSKNNIAVVTLTHDVMDTKDLSIDYKVYLGYSRTERAAFYGPANPNPGTDTEIAENAAQFGTSIGNLYSAGVSSNFKFFKIHTISFGYDFSGEQMLDYNVAQSQTTYTYFDNHGVFAQYNLDLGVYDLIAGVRMDKHNALTLPILSPRISMIGNFLNDKLHLRLSYGMGFRAPQAFSEDYHLSVTSGGGSNKANYVSNAPNLTQETSHSVSTDFSGEFAIDKLKIDFSVGAFWNMLIDAFELSSQDMGTYVMWTRSNVDGYVMNVGSNFELGLQFSNWFKFSNGITVMWLNNYYNDNGTLQTKDWGTSEVLRSPTLNGFNKVEFFVKDFTASVTLTHLGSMTVWSEETSTKIITGYMPILDIRFDYKIKIHEGTGTSMNIFIGVDNVLNQFMATEHISGLSNRDAALLYGPDKPFTLYAGTKISI